MAACHAELDVCASKAQLAAARAKGMRKKRDAYARACAEGSHEQPEATGRGERARAKPHRLARVAARKCLAKGLLEADEDVPAIVSMGRGGASKGKKPAVAPVMRYAGPAPAASREAARSGGSFRGQQPTDARSDEASTDCSDTEGAPRTRMDSSDSSRATPRPRQDSDPAERLAKGLEAEGEPEPRDAPAGPACGSDRAAAREGAGAAAPAEAPGAEAAEGRRGSGGEARPAAAREEPAAAAEAEEGDWELLPCAAADGRADDAGWSLIA